MVLVRELGSPATGNGRILMRLDYDTDRGDALNTPRKVEQALMAALEYWRKK